MKKILLYGVLAMSIVACSEKTQENTGDQQSDKQEQVDVQVTPNKVMIMEIDGMVCKMGCGGSIRKELKASGGVSNVEFDFEEERSTNTAKVYFDSGLIDEEKLVSLVKELNDGQFTVGETSTEDVVEVETEESPSTDSGADDVSIDAYTDDVEMPNLFDLFKGLFS
jgi:copper chaperone CopZ